MSLVYFAEGLASCPSDYLILETTDGESGLYDYRWSQQIDCVVLELDLPDRSGFEVLVDLVPLVRRPNVAVIVLTRLTDRGVWRLARENGAIACFVKRHMTPWIAPFRTPLPWWGCCPRKIDTGLCS